MSEFAWGVEVAEDVRPEQHVEAPAAEPVALAMSVDEFSALEERILRAVNLVKRERLARAAAEERAAAAETRLTEQGARLAEQAGSTDNLHKEIGALRAEREAVRQRVERLLSQLDALEV